MHIHIYTQSCVHMRRRVLTESNDTRICMCTIVKSLCTLCTTTKNWRIQMQTNACMQQRRHTNNLCFNSLYLLALTVSTGHSHVAVYMVIHIEISYHSQSVWWTTPTSPYDALVLKKHNNVFHMLINTNTHTHTHTHSRNTH